MNNAKPKTGGPWMHRFALWFFSILLAILLLWLLGFIMKDIKSIRGPDYKEIEKKHVDGKLVEKQESLEQEIKEISREIKQRQTKQKILGESTRSLQETIGQLLDIQKLSLEKNMALSDEEQKTFTESINMFLENQKRFQEGNQRIAEMTEQRNSLEMEKRQVQRRIEEQKRPARKEFNKLDRMHDLKLATLQLAIIIPILIIAGYLIRKKRGSIYYPFFLALGIATLLEAILVVRDYFPGRVFKYILLLIFLFVVARLLVYFIRSIAFPKTQWVLKQYREAYERFLCPVCEYPIRRGPLKFLFWNRRTVKRLKPAKEGFDGEESPYTCPSCGAGLYEECPSCHNIRQSLLTFCEHCGNKKEIE